MRPRKTFKDWLDFAQGTLGLSAVEAYEYATRRSVEDANRDRAHEMHPALFADDEDDPALD